MAVQTFETEARVSWGVHPRSRERRTLDRVEVAEGVSFELTSANVRKSPILLRFPTFLAIHRLSPSVFVRYHPHFE